MDQLYAVGVTIIQHLQDQFADYESYFALVNAVSNPNNSYNYVLPLVAIIDSVFAFQYVLCIAFGEWFNIILKWILSEDRPYWWVEETDFYMSGARPTIKQFPDTCETGPGSPSGHTMNASLQLILLNIWVAHILNDRQIKIRWHKYILWPFCVIVLLSVILARMFIGTHFIHQCILGAIVGAFVSPIMCIYVCDPYIWGRLSHAQVGGRILRHAGIVCFIIVISMSVYWTMKVFRIDPNWSIMLAFKWCNNVQSIKVTTTPFYSVVVCLGAFAGLVAVSTPQLSRYRHYSKRRNLLTAAITAYFLQQFFTSWQNSLSSTEPMVFYFTTFFISSLQSIAFIRALPLVARIPYVLIDRYYKKKRR